MMDQPPPGPDGLGEERPEGLEGGTSKRKFIALCVVGGLAVLGCLLVVVAPVMLTGSRAAYRTEAMSNQRQVGLALLEFDQEFGEMPSDATVAAVVKLTGSTLDFSDGSSNAMFRQLIAYGIQSEDIFYAKHPGGSVEPDNDIHGKHALAVGEVGFSYVEGLNTSGDPETPVLLTPMKTASFDQAWYFENYDGVVVLRLDNSVDRVPIRKSDEKPVDEHGVPILDAAQPYFGGKWPDVRHPRLKP